MSTKVLEVVNFSEMHPEWSWLEGRVDIAAPLRWTAVSTHAASWRRAPDAARRWAASQKASASAAPRSSVLVSHGPHMTLYGSAALASRLRRRRHLAYVFNFTELPTGARHKAMRDAFKSVDRFVCFSSMEQVYADHFGIDINRIDMIHWSVRPPEVDMTTPAAVEGDYICALGGQGRDYATLIAAMTRLPSVKLVLVATSHSVDGIVIPKNVAVRCGISLAHAMNALTHSRFNIIPLKGSRVPCAHVTIEAGMHLGKATIVTDSLGVAEYIQDGVNGLTVSADSPEDLASAIDQLWQSPLHANRLAERAREFASVHCVEPVVASYFARYYGEGQF